MSKGRSGASLPQWQWEGRAPAKHTQAPLAPVTDRGRLAVPALDDKGKPMLDEGGKAIMAPKYTGLHALRHFFCSWCAARPQDGGLGLPLKTVQARMGHSTLAMTADRYGHLFPSQDDTEVLAAGERALWAHKVPARGTSRLPPVIAYRPHHRTRCASYASSANGWIRSRFRKGEALERKTRSSRSPPLLWRSLRQLAPMPATRDRPPMCSPLPTPPPQGVGGLRDHSFRPNSP